MLQFFFILIESVNTKIYLSKNNSDQSRNRQTNPLKKLNKNIFLQFCALTH